MASADMRRWPSIPLPAAPALYPIDDLQASFGEAGDDHVKAVRAKIDGGVQAIVHCLTLCV